MKICDFFENEDIYVIAEIAQNHDGSLGQAHAYIDAVAETGADAIKFQTHIASEESTIQEPFRVKFSYCDKTRYDYWKRMEFTQEQWRELYNHATACGLDFLSSPFSNAAMDMLDEIGIPAWKLGSGEVFNEQLLKRMIATQKPIILSTGLSTFSDIDKQVELVKTSGNKLLLMQCTTAYPTKAEEIAINVLQQYQQRYQCPVGLSDHSATIFPSLAAITLGARAIEVHVTMDRRMFGPDVKASVTLEELRIIVEGSHYIANMRRHPGDKHELSVDMVDLKRIFSKSVYARRDICAGTVIQSDDIVIKKPYEGIGASKFDEVIGCIAIEDIKQDTPVKWEGIKRK